MEVEFDKKRFFLVIFLLAIIAGGILLWPTLSSSLPALGKTQNTPTPTTGQKVVASKVDITIQNKSAWQVSGVGECLPTLDAWLADYPLKSLTVVITDTVSADMTLGVTQSGQGVSDAKVKGKCEEMAKDELTCFIAIQQGEPAPNLDVAATVEVATLIQDFYRPKTKSAWENQDGNILSTFQPLIEMENNVWKSNCLHLNH